MRKNKLIILCCLFVGFVACGRMEPIYWDEVEVKYDDEQIGMKAAMSYPMCFGGVDSATTKINNQIEAFLKADILENCSVCSLDSAVVAFSQIKKADSMLYRIPYEFYSKGRVSRWPGFASVEIEKASYTGGANFNINTVFLNFDTRTGDLVPLQTIFSSPESLENNLEERFVATRGMTIKTFADSISLLPADKPFPLPQEIGFDSIGVVLYYNLYEVAPRSFGVTRLTIPYDSVGGLSEQYKKKFLKKE